jgi:hypothetical protein
MSSSIEQLPIYCIGNILDQLNNITGSNTGSYEIQFKNLHNITKYTVTLICTSKTMAAKVNDPEATLLFLKSLSAKYGKPYEELAADLNTKGTCQWLWSYIHQNGDDQDYQLFQEINKIACEVLEEAHKANLMPKDSCQLCPWPQNWGLTRKGFALNIAATHQRMSFVSISTPFGVMNIWKGCSNAEDRNYTMLSIAEILIKRLNCTFERFSSIKKNTGKIYEILLSPEEKIREINKNMMKKISQNMADDRVGTHCLLIHKPSKNSQNGNIYITVYKIRNINGVEAPDIVWHNREHLNRSHLLISKVWDMLEANRKGKNTLELDLEQSTSNNADNKNS